MPVTINNLELLTNLKKALLITLILKLINYGNIRSNHPEMFFKKGVLKYLRLFSCELSKIYKNDYVVEQLRMATFEMLKYSSEASSFQKKINNP